METLLINEQLVSQFKFWRNGQVQTGICFRSELFSQVAQFTTHQRSQAFELADRLGSPHSQSIVTVSQSHYTVWSSLRSPQAASPHPRNNSSSKEMCLS